jgi:hypothetical protein
MKLPGWSFILVGVFVSVLSGYVYLFIPKDGSPNMSMALFFFIGIIFVIFGVAKIFLGRPDTLQNQPLSHMVIQQSRAGQKPSATIPQVNAIKNRVEEHVNQMYAMQYPAARQNSNATIQNPNNTINNTNNDSIKQQSSRNNTLSNQSISQQSHTIPIMGHTSHYAKSHPYVSSSHHDSSHHDSSHHNSLSHNHTGSNEHSHATHHASSSGTAAITCAKCRTANHNHSNYCHHCGARLN